MNATDVITAGTVVTVEIDFTSFMNMGELTLGPTDVQPYFDAAVGMTGTLVVNTPLFNSSESIIATGPVNNDITAGQLQGQVLQAINNFNNSVWFGIRSPVVTVGIGNLAPGQGTGGPLPQIGNLLGNVTSLATVVVIGLAIWIGFQVFKEAKA